MSAAVAAEGLERERALVVLVEHVLPREADAAVHLDRALAGGHRRVGAVRLRGGGGDGQLLVLLRDAPRGPVGERAGQLGLDEGVRERVRYRLVDADRTAELDAVPRVLDRELERLLPDPDRLERDHRQLLITGGRVVEERRPYVGAPGLLVE